MMSPRIKCVAPYSNNWFVIFLKKKRSFSNAKIKAIYHFWKLWWNMFQNRKKWFLLVQWVAKINKKWWMKNPEAVIRFPRWCNLTLIPQFWATKVCLQVSKISKICLVTRLGEQLLKKQVLEIIQEIIW